MATYVNDLRLKEIATGDEAGTWGASTNTNLELIAEAFSYGTEASFGSDADATTTIADGSTDPARSLYLKVTSGASLTATRTLTIAPNTVSKVWIIENATSGSQSINISQGSGANVTIPSGKTKIVYSDGAGSGAAVVDALASLNLETSGIIETSSSIQTPLIEYTDGDDAMTIADGGQVTFAQNIIGTLGTAAQPNITSLGTLTALTGGTGDLNWDSGTLFVDSSANSVGIGTTSPANNLHIGIDSGSKGILVKSTGDHSGILQFDVNRTDGNRALGQLNGLWNGTSVADIQLKTGSDTTNKDDGEITFHTSSADNISERMRIDSSGNVGIGNTSPSAKLTINNSIATTYTITGYAATAANSILYLNNTHGGSNTASLINFRAGSGDGVIGFVEGGGTNDADFVIQTDGGSNGVERLRITNSGNVGIGTGIPDYLLEAYNGDISSLKLTSAAGGNAVHALRFRVRNSGNTSQYATLGTVSAETVSSWGGVLTFSTKPASGSPDENTTERMRIDSSGNVGIGTSSPGYQLDLRRNDTGTTPSLGIRQLGTGDASMAFQTTTSPYGFIIGVDASDGEKFKFSTGTSDVGAATKLTIDTSGNVGIGTSSPSSILHVDAGLNAPLVTIHNTNGASSDSRGLDVETSTTGTTVQRWFNAGSELARFTALGRLLIGGTADRGSNLQIGGTSSTARVLPMTDNVGYVGEAAFRWQAIYAVTGSIQTSDEREKTEIKETTLGLDFIKDLKPVSYKWIDGEQQNKGKDEREHQGLIAQQVAETVEKHGIDKNNFGGLDIQKTEKYDDFHGMSYDQFVAPLIKAIQEQQAQIEALQSEINLLKGE